MDWREFTSNLIDSLAWPAAVVILGVIFRKRLGELVSGQLQRFKAGPGGVELVWDRVAQRTREAETAAEQGAQKPEPSEELPPRPAPVMISLRQELEPLARDQPRRAVIEAYKRVENELRKLLAAKLPPGAETAEGTTLAGLAVAHGLLSHATVQSLEGLNVLRNLAVHGREELNPGRAMEFLDLADGVVYSIRYPPERR